MENIGETILKLLDSSSTPLSSLDIAKTLKEDHQRVVGAIKSLECLEDVIETEPVSKKVWELTKEGEEVADRGSHEALVYQAVPEEGIDQQSLMASFSGDPTIGKIGFSKAIASKWIVIDKSGGKPVVRRNVPSINDGVKELLVKMRSLELESVGESEKSELKKRKLASEGVLKYFLIKKGGKFVVSVEKPETDLTGEMIQKGTWKEKRFKEYNFNALGVSPERGHLHPLLKVREQFRQIFLELGFSEMPTNNFVENSFWNFDALFQPQQHPARDAHDTFFVKDPERSEMKKIPEEYVERVKKVHSIGGYGSTGYRYEWKEEEAEKNILRTHTTAVSARMLYKVAQDYASRKREKTADGKKENHPDEKKEKTADEKKNPEHIFQPVKLFSIDRVFRNETLDATHLAEFHQIEGVVANVGLSLGDLMGIIQEFFHKLGLDRIKFKPAYNPYTEPSMEIFSYHEGLGKWVEVGNSGMFRPEMLLPMGLPEDVSVIAWGLSTERPTMIKYGINNIRDLVGHKVDLQMVYNNPLCILSEAID